MDTAYSTENKRFDHYAAEEELLEELGPVELMAHLQSLSAANADMPSDEKKPDVDKWEKTERILFNAYHRLKRVWES